MIAAGAAFKLTQFSFLPPGSDPFYLAQSYGKQSEVELVSIQCIESQRNTCIYITATLQLCEQTNNSPPSKLSKFCKKMGSGYIAELKQQQKGTNLLRQNVCSWKLSMES